MRRLLTTFILLLAAAGLVACGSDVTTSTTGSSVPGTTTPASTTPDTTAPATTAPDTTAAVTTTVPAGEAAIAYFVRDERLVAVRRTIASWDGGPLMAALLAGPSADESAAGIVTAVPDGTEVHTVVVAGNVATVDLSAAFESGGGSLSMTLRVAQVVFTLTQLPDVDVVRFRIDGTAVDSIGGEGVMVTNADRVAFDSSLPSILLETPLTGDAWVDPLMIGGMSDTFEATVNFQVVGPDGAVLQEGVTIASCGTGCRGVFAQQLDPLPAGTTGPVTIRVFDISEADGSVIDLVEVTLTV